jgi:hypothetical protein
VKSPIKVENIFFSGILNLQKGIRHKKTMLILIEAMSIGGRESIKNELTNWVGTSKDCHD